MLSDLTLKYYAKNGIMIHYSFSLLIALYGLSNILSLNRLLYYGLSLQPIQYIDCLSEKFISDSYADTDYIFCEVLVECVHRLPPCEISEFQLVASHEIFSVKILII